MVPSFNSNNAENQTNENGVLESSEPYIGCDFRDVNFESEYAPFALWDADFGPLGQNQHPTRPRDGNV